MPNDNTRRSATHLFAFGGPAVHVIVVVAPRVVAALAIGTLQGAQQGQGQNKREHAGVLRGGIAESTYRFPLLLLLLLAHDARVVLRRKRHDLQSRLGIRLSKGNVSKGRQCKNGMQMACSDLENLIAETRLGVRSGQTNQRLQRTSRHGQSALGLKEDAWMRTLAEDTSRAAIRTLLSSRLRS